MSDFELHQIGNIYIIILLGYILNVFFIAVRVMTIIILSITLFRSKDVNVKDLAKYYLSEEDKVLLKNNRYSYKLLLLIPYALAWVQFSKLLIVWEEFFKTEEDNIFLRYIKAEYTGLYLELNDIKRKRGL
jgi:hypothetical protein